MIQKFLDREEEIEKVEEKYRSDKAEFVLIYGRRRIGKTELIKKFIEVKVYASVGGVPAYLKEFNDSFTFVENINRTFFNKDHVLFDDAERLLKDELREPYVYLSILEQISEGATTLSEISSKSRVDVTNLPKYLKVLENMGLIKKIYPVIRERKSKRGIYKILDYYFHFWLKFVHRYKEEIELGTMEFSTIAKEFNRYVGAVFEDLAMEFVIKKSFYLPFQFIRIGKWWYKDKEIDLIALNEHTKQIAFFEVKWHEFEREKEARGIIEKLKEKSEFVNWFNPTREEYFGIIAKKIGAEVKEALRDEGYLVFDMADGRAKKRNCSISCGKKSQILTKSEILNTYVKFI